MTVKITKEVGVRLKVKAVSEDARLTLLSIAVCYFYTYVVMVLAD